MVLPDLPDEIHMLIVRHFAPCSTQPFTLHPADKSSKEADINRSALCAYALTRRHYRNIALPYLFSSIIMEVTLLSKRSLNDAEERIFHCAETLFKSNGLNVRRFIKSFALILNISTSSPAHQSKMQRFLESNSLADILNALHESDCGIESLTFSTRGNMAYTGMCTNFRHAFENLLRSPTLRHIQLDGISEIPRTFLSRTYIKAAEFYSTNLQSSTPAEQGSSCQPILLKSIGLEETFRIIDALYQNIGAIGHPHRYKPIFKELTLLHCRLTSYSSLLSMVDIAAHSARSLQTLNIQLSGLNFHSNSPIMTSHPDPDHGYEFHLLQHLSSLRISIVTCSSVSLNQPNCVRPFLDILEKATLPNALEKLMLELTTHVTWESSSDISSCVAGNLDHWKDLDIFLGRAMFKNVCKISLVIKCSITVEKYARDPFDIALFEGTTRRYLEDVLPLLTATSDNARPRQRRHMAIRAMPIHDLGLDTGDVGDGNRGLYLHCGGPQPYRVPLYDDV